jgi:hypothetical protein
MADKKLSVRQTAELLGISIKATQQAIHREAFPIERDVGPKTGRTQRVWIPRSSVEGYARKRRIPLDVVGRSAVRSEPSERRLSESRLAHCARRTGRSGRVQMSH